MAFPFTIEQFLEVFKNYNLSVWPMQILLVSLAVISFYLVIKKQSKLVSLFLAFFWFWIGIVYHIIFFSEINKAAYIFGVFFIIQGGLFLLAGFRNKIHFKLKKNLYGIIGLIFIIFSIAIYPILNYVFGHGWPNNPTFGLPCPTTIFTFGILLLTEKKFPKYLVVIPVLWSLIGVSAAISLGIWEDMGLVIAGVLGTILLIFKK